MLRLLLFSKFGNEEESVIFYNTPKGDIKIEVVFNNETFWLTQIGVEVPAISKHLNNIYERELDKKSTISILETVQQEGTRQIKRKLEFYNLDAIIAVGYRG